MDIIIMLIRICEIYVTAAMISPTSMPPTSETCFPPTAISAITAKFSTIIMKGLSRAISFWILNIVTDKSLFAASKRSFSCSSRT